MRSSAACTASVVAGMTRCTNLVSSPPLSLRSTPEGLFLVGSGAGPIGGDELSLDVTVDAGASITVRSAAASMVLPGPTAAPSTMTVRAAVAGFLTWQPEPTVLVAGCDHRASAYISVAPGGRLVWREEIVLGRHAEPSGSLLQRLHVDVDGRPLLRTELPVGPRWPGSAGPAGVDGARAIGSLVVVGLGEPKAPEDTTGARASVVQLSDAAWLVTVLAERPAQVRRCLEPIAAVEPCGVAVR